MEKNKKPARKCCFIGHRTVCETDELKKRIDAIVRDLIENENVNVFLFSAKGRFNDLCHEIVTQNKERYPHIKRVYVRAEYPTISDGYRTYLSASFEETCFPERILRAGRAVYIERNEEMIKNSDFCVFYYDERRTLRKSGTKTALDYADKLKKRTIRLP